MSGTECARCGGLVNQEGRCSVCGITRDMGGDGGGRSPQPERADIQMPRRTDSSKQARPAFLFNKLTNESFPLTQSVSKIGRDQTNNISLASDHYISRHHAWVLQMQGGYWVEDLGSTNGTLLNGEVLSERKQIFPGDRITFGKTELVFVVE
jgi:pSer/pThr/pTyr-binding forkhead associated (FHA) protein